MTGTRGDLLRVSLPGGKQSQLLSFSDSSVLDPALSPDGQRIAFVRVKEFTTGTTDFGTDIWAVNKDGSGLERLVQHASPSELLRWPQWLADGQTLIMQVQGAPAAGASANRIEKVDLRGGARSVLVDGGLTPSLSRDRRSLVYLTSDLASGRQSIWRLSLDGGQPQKVLDSTASMGAFGYAVLSPDGARVAFGAATLNAQAPAASRPYQLAERGSGRPRTEDVSRLVTDGLPEDLWLVNADGSGARLLAQMKEDQPSMAWSGDGKKLYVLGGTGLWQVDAASGSRKRLADGVIHGELIWAPLG